MNPLIIICGPTGVGKSALALALAQELNAEIVSADAGQVYQGFDIGTAKPSAEERRRVRHHGIDLWPPDVGADVMLWQRAADQAITEITAWGKRILVVGGTGFYVKVLLRGLFAGPDPDPELRRDLLDEFEGGAGAQMHERLNKIDPEAASRIHPHDPVRLVRALEVYEQTGKTITEQQRAHGFAKQRYPYRMFALMRDRTELYDRINQRVASMMAAGWIAEAEALYQRWGRDAPAFRLIGYRQIRDYLSGCGRRSALLNDIQQASRRYAKRQLTWLRREPRLRWLDGKRGLDSLLAEVDNRFESELKGRFPIS